MTPKTAEIVDRLIALYGEAYIYLEPDGSETILDNSRIVRMTKTESKMSEFAGFGGLVREEELQDIADHKQGVGDAADANFSLDVSECYIDATDTTCATMSHAKATNYRLVCWCTC